MGVTIATRYIRHSIHQTLIGDVHNSLHVLGGDLLSSCIVSFCVTDTNFDSWQSVSGRTSSGPIALKCGFCSVVRITVLLK